MIVFNKLKGINDWRSIQDVVRITFKSFHDVLRSQAEQIKSLERQVDSKAGRSEVATAMQQKANAGEVASKMTELELMLHSKADISDMERRALKTDIDASLRTQMSDVFTILNTKSEAGETKVWKDSSDRQIAHLDQEVARLQRALDEQRALIHSKASVVEVSQALSVKADVVEVEEKMREKAGRVQMTDALSRKADGAELDLSLGQIRQQMADIAAGLNRKGDASRIEALNEKCERVNARVDADSDTNAAALRAISSSFDTALDQLRDAATAQSHRPP
jgi:hypothetical protein